MIHIKGFIDKISYMESRQKKDVVLTLDEARSLRDEITKLLLDLRESNGNRKQEPIEIILQGGRW